MSNEKTFTVVGTAINADGTLKMRWTNDLIWRINSLIKADCSEIELYELPSPMTKLAAAIWLEENIELNPFQQEIVSYKIFEKTKMAKRNKLKEQLTHNVNQNINSNKPLDPRTSQAVTYIEREAAC